MMFFRYIIDLFTFLFSKCKYKRKNFFANLVVKFFLKTKNIRKESSLNETSFLDWITSLNSFEKIAVLGSGPSLNKLTNTNNQTLYLTTNSSVCKVINQHFIYFTFTREYINTYLIFGFKNPGWEGSVFLFTKSKENHKIRMKSYKRIKYHISSIHQKKTEFMLSNLKGNKNEAKNFKLINQFAFENFGLEYDNLNSGISLFILGLFFAKRLNKPIEIFGIDAGINGLNYADKHFDIPGKEVNDQTTKEALNKIFSSINKMGIQFTNHTFFQPNLFK